MTEKISSYDKIARHLMALPDWKVMQTEFLRFLDSLHVTGCEFNVFRNYSKGGGPEEVDTKFVVEGTIGQYQSKMVLDTLSHFTGPSTFPTGQLIPEAWCNEVVDRHFGKNKKQVPTYFCKKDKLEEKWPPAARLALVKEHEEKVGETLNRLVEEWKALNGSPAMIEGRTRHFELHVIEQIKKVMLQYGTAVRPAVLKEALDEYVAHAIMEA